MTRKEALRIIGPHHPKWALRNMAKALQMMTWRNNEGDWLRLAALKSLGYKVTVDIPAHLFPVTSTLYKPKEW